MSQLIPTFQEASSNFEQEIILDGLVVTINMRWNTRAACWLVSLDSNGYTLLNKKLLPNWPLLRQSRASFPLSGDILALPVDAAVGSILNYNNLNDGFQLVYFDQFEMEAWESLNGI